MRVYHVRTYVLERYGQYCDGQGNIEDTFEWEDPAPAKPQKTSLPCAQLW